MRDDLLGRRRGAPATIGTAPATASTTTAAASRSVAGQLVDLAGETRETRRRQRRIRSAKSHDRTHCGAIDSVAGEGGRQNRQDAR